MRVFVLNPKEEQVRSFNDRLAAFCEENPSIAISSQIADGQLVLTVLEAEDVAIPTGHLPVVTATVRPLSVEALEDRTNALIDQIVGKDDDGPILVDMQIRERSDKPGTGWVVAVACVGITDADGEEMEDEAFPCPHCGKMIEPAEIPEEPEPQAEQPGDESL